MQNINQKINKKHLTIGYLAPGFYKGLYVSLFTGVLNGARECNANLLCFSGSSHGDLYENDKQANIIFDFVNPNIMDGIICWTTGLYVGKSYLFDIEKLLEKNKGIPFVCIGKPLHDFPTIQMDNFDGINQLVSHFVEVHGYKKIAFIKGPEFHNYAVDRFSAYIEALKKYNIPLDERLITKPGNWDHSTGEKAVNYFFNELKLKPKIDIDAIVTVSDLVSAGAIKQMHKLGIDVPNDIAIVGFNNKPESIEMSPPLTTIDPYFTETGKISVKTVVSLINKEDVPRVINISTKLVIRDSCGCLPSAFFTEKNYTLPVFSNNNEKRKSLQEVFTESEDDFLKKMIKFLDKNKYVLFNLEWISGLYDCIRNEFVNQTHNSFSNYLKKILEEVLYNNQDIPVWQEIISKFRILILQLLTDEELVLRAENIFHNARVLILEKLNQSIAIEKINQFRMEDLFPSISSAIVTTFKQSALIAIIEKELPHLGIPACYLTLYMDSQKPLDKSKLIMAYDESGNIDTSEIECIFPSQDIFPEGILNPEKRFEIIVKPLFFQDNPIGSLLFKVGPIDSTMYINLRSYISSALQGSILVKNVEDRAHDLEEAYKTLKDNQQRLVVAEKMASLGRLTAGIAHEMNTPLASVRASIKELGFLVDEYKKSISDVNVVSEDHKAIAFDMTKHLNLAMQSVERSVGFIRGIKTQTYNLPTKSNQEFDATSLIRDNLNILEYLFKRRNCSLVIDLENSIKLSGEPRYLSQILTNLVINAVDACKPEVGKVTVNFKKSDQIKAELSVVDNGSGINQENLSKIFDPFFTTKSFGEGTGLGLSIVHDMVNEFNGYIEVKSVPGNTKFSIIFPLIKV